MSENAGISRRTAVRRTGLLGAAAVAGTARIPVSAGAGKGRAKAFALVGDRYHNSDYIRTALGKTLAREAGISIDFTDEVTMLSEETLQHYRMLIVFRDGMLWPDGYGKSGSYPGLGPETPELRSIPPLPETDAKPVPWLTAEQGRAVRDFVESGGSAFFFHNAGHISLSDADFRDVEGAVYAGHPPIRPFWVRIVNRKHPITRGVEDFLVTDEQHYVEYDKGSEHVLMRSENADGLPFGDRGTSCEAGWAYEYGKGRVCFMAPGHMISALWNPEYVKLQKQAARWLLREI